LFERLSENREAGAREVEIEKRRDLTKPLRHELTKDAGLQMDNGAAFSKSYDLEICRLGQPGRKRARCGAASLGPQADRLATALQNEVQKVPERFARKPRMEGAGTFQADRE
jgi:hypothetical protein